MPIEIYAHPQKKCLNNVLPGDTFITTHIVDFGLSPLKAATNTSLLECVGLRVSIQGEELSCGRHDTDVESAEESGSAFVKREVGTVCKRARAIGAFETCLYVASKADGMQLRIVMNSCTEREVNYLPVGGDQ